MLTLLLPIQVALSACQAANNSRPSRHACKPPVGVAVGRIARARRHRWLCSRDCALLAFDVGARHCFDCRGLQVDGIAEPAVGRFSGYASEVRDLVTCHAFRNAFDT
jgi:hypothetical protein